MADALDDQDVMDQINRLASREEELRGLEAERGLDVDERAEMRRVEIELDRLWDLVRQRRARRAAGEDPSAAALREPETVERYLQ